MATITQVKGAVHSPAADSVHMSEKIVCRQHGAGRQSRKDVLFREEWFKFYPSEVWLLLNWNSAPRVWNATDKSYYVIRITISMFIPSQGPRCTCLSVPLSTPHTGRINPNWDSAEVALDFDWIFEHRVFPSILIPINFAGCAIDLINMSGGGSALSFAKLILNQKWVKNIHKYRVAAQASQ